MADETTQERPFLRDRWDVPAMCLLALACTLAWCSANGKWTAAAWQMPAAYTAEPQKADVIHLLAMMKAGSKGEFLPVVWKQVDELGAPYEGNWNDWPMVEEVVVSAFGLLGRIFGLFAGLNVAALLGNVLAALVFYGVARASACTPLWAGVGGLAFGLAPFIFAHSPFHVGREWIWQVPLFLPIWRQVSTEPGITPGTPRFRVAVGLGFLFGLLNQYYSYVFCQLVILGAAIQYVRTRSRPQLLAACAIVAAAALGFALMQVDTWSYRLANGPNSGALVREYKWIEIYGLKIKDLLIPPVTHRSDAVAAFSAAHRQAAPLLDEDGASYQGIVGLAALAWLVGTAVAALVRGRERDVPMEAWQVLWIVIMFTTGGLNAIVAAFGLTLFRAACGYSVVILAISLLWAARRLSAIRPGGDEGTASILSWTGAALAVLVVLWDQVPRPPTPELTAAIATQVKSDRDFTERMEAALPAGAAVFQLPVMDFPESPVPGISAYEHFRPYLFSDALRYSYGSMKGRERDRWQREVQEQLFAGAVADQQAQKIRFDAANVARAVAAIRERGFTAIYLNRAGFPDRGRGLEVAILDLGRAKPPIRSETGDLSCIVLEAAGTEPAP